MKPVHPRNRGKEPQMVQSKAGRMYLNNLRSKNGKVYFSTVVEFWEKTLLAHTERGERIVEEATFASTMYDSDIWLEYTYEFDNQNYAAEKAEWDADVARYEVELAAWQVEADRRRNGTENIDEKILKAEHRLANLQAVRDGKPIPFP